MKQTKTDKQAVVATVSSILEQQAPLGRSQLIDRTLAAHGLTGKDSNPSSHYNKARSLVGTVLTELCNLKLISRNADGYFLLTEQTVVLDSEKCRCEILKLLKSKPRTKNEIFQALIVRFGADKTTSLKDDNAIKSLAGTLLARLLETQTLQVHSGVYSVPTKELSVLLRKPLPEEQFKPKFFDYLYEQGGAFFERFLSNVLEKYFTLTGRTVISCDVTGGSADGGVDIILETLDDLGFFEKIMVQAKCRDHNHVTEKEVREFYGAMTALSGSRGIFATTTEFHPGADRLLKSLGNCVGIDGNKLFELIKKTDYGIHRTKNGFTVDFSVFP